jgi:hypothetical protein
MSSGLRSAALVQHDVMPNPSFKGEAQRHGTLAIKCRACGPFCTCCPVRHAAGLPLTPTLGGTNTHREHLRIFPSTGGSVLRQCMGLLRTMPMPIPMPKLLSFAGAKHPQTATQARSLQNACAHGRPGQHQQAQTQTQTLRLKCSVAIGPGKLCQEFKTQIQRFVFKPLGPVSARRWASVGVAPGCRLTLRSRGRPNGMAHWPASAGACAPFCACCPARHAAGLPLNSNVRRHATPCPDTDL